MLWESELESVPPRASLSASELLLSDKSFIIGKGLRAGKIKCSVITCFSLFKFQVIHHSTRQDVVILCLVLLGWRDLMRQIELYIPGSYCRCGGGVGLGQGAELHEDLCLCFPV